jgi:hypothetical protein
LRPRSQKVWRYGICDYLVFFFPLSFQGPRHWRWGASIISMRRRFLDLKPKDVTRERFRTSACADTCCFLCRFASFSKLPCWFHVCVFDLMDRLGGSLPDVLWPGCTGSLWR